MEARYIRNYMLLKKLLRERVGILKLYILMLVAHTYTKRFTYDGVLDLTYFLKWNRNYTFLCIFKICLLLRALSYRVWRIYYDHLKSYGHFYV